MHRLMRYYLSGLFVIALFFCFLKILPFNPFYLLISALVLLTVSLLTNYIFAKTFNTAVNVESVYITAFILALIITPLNTFSNIWFLVWAAILSIASKFIFSINKRRLFNPVIFAIVITSFVLNQSASWWIGTLPMIPFVLLGGILIVRKIRKTDLAFYFLFVAVVTTLTLSAFSGTDIINMARKIILFSPLLFFAFVMMTEPKTIPPGKKAQILYGVLVGFLFAPQIHFGSLYLTPELALLAGNLFSFIIRL